MTIIAIIKPILILGVIGLIGFLTSLRVEVTKESKNLLASIVLNIALPAVIIQSIFQSTITKEDWINFSYVVFIALLLNGTGITIGYFICRKLVHLSVSNSKKVAVLSGCGNTAFMGIPVVSMFLGTSSGLYASIYDLGTVLTVFTVGVMLLQSSKFTFKQLKSVLNAPFITIVISLSLVSLNIGLPDFLLELSAMLAAVAAPLSMLYIGMLFTKEKLSLLRSQYKKLIFTATFVKTFFLPAVALIIIIFLPLSITLKQVIALQAGMPSFLTASVLFEKYTGSEGVGTITIMFTAMLSLITLPGIYYISIFL
ncbi:AEC family transporter [Oceanobacillus alkalisoli]|uniref:AEC family transporter n=1 Tax=Oceanobacillus alkalisoli TaxID=2925113 RepID=UPI001F11EF04|nr:AEC family transporter [Oceanobacillus alkalisoli]MCF3942590.1 AEC family transporter [Oceanobacillus alkalisoli]